MLSTNTFLSLNLDVLLEIASHLSMSDLIRLSMVRKDAAITHIARDVALTKPFLQNGTQVIPFCDYMLANASERMHRVEELTLLTEVRWEDDIERTVAVRVAHLLLQTRNLRRLHLARSQFLMKLDPRIQRAVADLPHLTKLVLDRGGDLTAKAVSMLRSRPRELAHDNNGYRNQKYDCSSMLFRNPSLSGTKCLHLSWLDGSLINVSRHEIIQHPSVTTLSVTLSDVDMSLFAFAFANVRKLCLWNLCLPKSLRIQGPRAKWASLDSVSAHIDDIAKWHITCPVYSLTLVAAVSRDVMTVLPDTRSEQKGLILRAVQEMKPVCLSIEVDVLTGTPFWTQLVVSSPRLTWLEIQLIQNAQESKQAMITWESTVLPVLSSLKITCIKVNLEHSCPFPNIWCMIDDTIADEQWITLTIFLRTLPDFLLQTIPSLRYISVGTDAYGCTRCREQYLTGKYRDPSVEVRYWRVLGSAQERTLELLPKDIGEDIFEGFRNTPNAKLPV